MVIDTMVFAYALLRVEDKHEQAIAALETAEQIVVLDSQITSSSWNKKDRTRTSAPSRTCSASEKVRPERSRRAHYQKWHNWRFYAPHVHS